MVRLRSLTVTQDQQSFLNSFRSHGQPVHFLVLTPEYIYLHTSIPMISIYVKLKVSPTKQVLTFCKKNQPKNTSAFNLLKLKINRKYFLLRKVKLTFCLNHCRPVILMRKPPLHTHTHTKAQIFTQTAEVRKRSTTSTWSGVKMAHFLNLPGSPCSYFFFFVLSLLTISLSSISG